jgi:hypothetical protein
LCRIFQTVPTVSSWRIVRLIGTPIIGWHLTTLKEIFRHSSRDLEVSWTLLDVSNCLAIILTDEISNPHHLEYNFPINLNQFHVITDDGRVCRNLYSVLYDLYFNELYLVIPSFVISTCFTQRTIYWTQLFCLILWQREQTEITR